MTVCQGNPGLVEFYEHFAKYLHDHTQLPIIGVSHTGHLSYESKKWKPAGYEQQITDKVKFLRDYILKNRTEPINMYLIGHSIGCDIILKVLNAFDDNSIKFLKSILLFPVIERMSSTPNGRKFTPLLNYFLWPILCLSFLITCLPNRLLRRLIAMSYGKDTNENVRNALHFLTCTYSCMQSALIMAKDELRSVKQANWTVIEKNFQDLIFFYGTKDSWAPVEYYYGLVEQTNSSLNNKNIILDSGDLEHAFVLSNVQTETLSRLIGEWIS
jgi:hypothetical protein